MKIEITLPTLHTGQLAIYKELDPLKNIYACGRRFGKTQDMVTKSAMNGIRGEQAGLFTAEYKQLAEPFDQLRHCLQPLIKTASRNEGTINLKTGGKIDFWTLNDNYLAGRGRTYDHVYIDEAAFTKNGQMMEIWQKSIEPTLLTTNGKVTIYSTPNGIDDDNFFYKCWHDVDIGFKRHHAPTSLNPYVNPEYLEKKRLTTHPLVYRQEYAAEFVDWSGVAFFSAESLTVNGQGVDFPTNNDYVYATIDSAMKDGSGNDGTAVVYWAASKFFGHPLTILDWEIVQINSDLLVTWLPNVFQRLEQLAALTKSRGGSAGAWIEDKGSGITLNQTSQRMGWPAQPIAGDITSTGKDGRAISASGAVYRGEVKISAFAYDKVMEFKGNTRNHLLSQVCAYRIGDKDAAKRADDLTDAFCYGIIIGLGGQDGF
jgi:hypothetical protein